MADEELSEAEKAEQQEIDKEAEQELAADDEVEVTEADKESLEDKVLSFADLLQPGERKHLFSLLDKGQESDAEVQGYRWRSWRVVYVRRRVVFRRRRRRVRVVYL